MKIVIVLFVVLWVLVGYQQPVVREWIDTYETQRIIEARCKAIAECRTVDGEVHCWIIDVNDTIQSYGWDDRPSNLQVAQLCIDLKEELI